ncbi:tetratricopeptide repeat protein [Phytohabitans sp. ZYX-F-186]|uniref:Tetratricopeptide repeat protein n=1 Tax=Phytohabitans maris TaxID=3071409 RepID=A0ABU0Z9W1_9ACTN|nr:tetratricopeptide repeat protein [Phytohabitans sp. ZYX-F-186]MDQ7903186.1 tetratricopeptide repeat protein [Phytohabitans sp. ZYX-F-186]
MVGVGWTPTADDKPTGTAPQGERQLHARDGESIFQSAGNQIFYHHQPPPAVATPSNILPRDTAAFTGRDRELKALLDTVTQRAETQTIVPLYAIDGMPGVGKTAFAIHAGHMLQDHFPDGQFHIDLHAHSPGQRPADPADALFQLISADGVPTAEIPRELDDRAVLWRRRMAHRRALVILDNAESRKQVQPLLPGTAHCLVLITSRSRLTGLVATQAAVNLTLETLPPEDATALFAAVAGRQLEPVEAGAVDDLMRVCGYLPLAICLLATRLRLEPRWPVDHLVDELTEAKHALSRMRAEDVTVEAAFGLSYRRLSTAHRRFFRRLGLHPGPDVDRYAAAALDGSSPRQAGRFLETLYHQHLLDQPRLGRYRMHDLIREYSIMRAEGDSPRERENAVVRLLDYYRRAAESAGRHLSRPSVRPFSSPGDGEEGLPPIRTRRQAMSWMKAEQANLFACAGTQPARRRGASALPALAAAMAPYLRLAGPWDLAIALHERAAGTAEAGGDKRSMADALRELGLLRRHAGQYPAAASALQRAFELYDEIGDELGVADAQTELGGVRWRLGSHAEAAAELRAALATYRKLGVRHGQARALHEMGTALWAVGAYEEALDASEQALCAFEELSDHQGAAEALHQVGGLQQLTVGYPPAIDAQRRALALYRELGDRLGEAKALAFLGAAHSHTGDYDASRKALDLALAIQRDLGDGEGEAHTLNYLAATHIRSGRHKVARRLLTDALALYRKIGYRSGQADVLNQLGVLERLASDHGAAAETHEQALALFQQASDELGQSEAHSNIGDLLLTLGRPEEALGRYGQALDLATRAKNPNAEANALNGAGRCHLHLNNSEKGIELLRQAQNLYRRIGVAHAADAITELLNECPR